MAFEAGFPVLTVPMRPFFIALWRNAKRGGPASLLFSGSNPDGASKLSLYLTGTGYENLVMPGLSL